MYTPQEYQNEFHCSPARFKNIIGGVRSGKSHSAAREFYKRLCFDLAKAQAAGKGSEFMHYWIITPDFPLGKVAMRETFATIRQHNIRHVKKWRQSYKELELYPNILIEFKSANDPNKLVAVKLHGGWIDEVARLKAEAWMGGVRQRFTDLEGWCIFSTSPLGKNWYYQEIIRRGDPEDILYDTDFANFWFKTSQNGYIPKGEIEAARRQLPPKYFRREYEASLEEFFGQIYEEFSRKVHGYPRPGIEAPMKFNKIICGIDWGFATPGCFMVFGKDYEEVPNYFELETIYQERMLVTKPGSKTGVKPLVKCETWLDHAIRLKDKFPEIVFYPGKDKPEYIEIFKAAGLAMMDTDYSVAAGIQTVNKLHHVNPKTGLPRMFYRNQAPREVFEERESYQWATDRGGLVKDEPKKEFDHSVDAERYAVHGEETKPKAASVIIDPNDSDDPDWYLPETYMSHGPGNWSR